MGILHDGARGAIAIMQEDFGKCNPAGVLGGIHISNS
jgi:hypothetical protein